MKADALFVIMAIVFIFAAWVATGGPSRPISTTGPFITPVTRPGEESQGYRYIVPTNPINTTSYPKQIGGAPSVISQGNPNAYTRNTDGAISSSEGSVALEHSTLGPASDNPNQEYVTVVNRGTADARIEGWYVESDRTGASIPLQRYTLPGGQKLHVVSGRGSENSSFYRNLCEQPDANCAFLNRNFDAYARDRETITLYDERGRVVDSFSY